MGLIRGLPKLKLEKDLVCHPCRHGKMVAASHTPVNQVMTSYPNELHRGVILGYRIFPRRSNGKIIWVE